jgi:di/tricarboxylate transporter
VRRRYHGHEIEPMIWEAWFAVGVTILVLLLLALTTVGADIILMGGLTLLLVSGVLEPAQALAGLSNEGMVTVAVLFVVVAGLQETGTISWLGYSLLGRPRTVPGAQMRLMGLVGFLSAFLNNTPVVAMFIPAVRDWARRNEFPVSKLMLPLSYAAIFGGTCTLIGTSTNLVVNGMLVSEAKMPGMSLFSLAWVGVPAALVGGGYVVVMGRWLLPARKPAITRTDDPREYSVEMLVEPNGPLVGKTIETAGLRSLPGLFLIEIDREGEILPAVAPTEKLRAGDRLVFVGVVESVVDLQKLRGLSPATNQVFKLDAPRTSRLLVETVVSNTCQMIGKSIREGGFRTVYGAAVIAVARNGERLRIKIGDIVLRPGDTLLLEAPPSFIEQQRNSRDFFLVSPIEDSGPPRHDKAPLAIAIAVAMVVSVTAGWLSMLQAAMLAAVMMILSRCCSVRSARRAIEWEVLIVIAAAIGVGQALQHTGAASTIAANLIQFAAGNPWIALAIVYALTSMFTEVITNNAAAVLVFPIALATSQSLDVNFMPYAVAVMMAASASFATPLGYQTNLMVAGPGGYRFGDYVRFGLPLNILLGIVTVSLTPLIWPF